MTEMTKAATDVLAERERQKSVEGWTAEHDDEHAGGEMAGAAACYATGRWLLQTVSFYRGRRRLTEEKPVWPWGVMWWKPRDKRSNLVRAGALILAEIERIDRAASPYGKAVVKEKDDE